MPWSADNRSNGQCVEYTNLGALIAVRDSKNPNGPALTFTRDAWRIFVEHLMNGDPRGR